MTLADVLAFFVGNSPYIAIAVLMTWLYLRERDRVRDVRNQHIEDLREWSKLTKRANGS